MSSKLTILFTPIEAMGHFNISISIAETLRDRGHRVVFAVSDEWKGKLIRQGFQETHYSTSNGGDSSSSESFGEMVSKMAGYMQLETVDQIDNLSVNFYNLLMSKVKVCEPQFRRIVKELEPDVIVADYPSQQPAFMNSGIPWIYAMSSNPMGISNKNVPPIYSGYSTKGDQKLWKIFEDKLREVNTSIIEDFNSWLVSNGGEPLKHFHQMFINFSPYANIYMYPKELDYTGIRPNPPNWFQFDSFIRSSVEVFEIPEKLRTMTGRLIYFSLGTIGCSELGLMRKLIGILAKSPHRFIVSKGPFADDLDLPGNMWGAAFLPQTKVIPLVDLVITHGGNNTITETLYFGKPLVVLPLFGDQLDGAQRLLDLGYGQFCLPYKLTEPELLTKIEMVLMDTEMKAKLARASKRIQTGEKQGQERAADLVESVAKEKIII